MLIAGVILYVFGQLALGLYVARRVQNQTDFLLAGRSLGYTLATFTIFATWFGAETCIGAAGQIAAHGLGGGSADPFGYAICLLLMGALFAAALWRRGIATVADLMRERYSPAVESATALLVAPGSFLWAGAQIRAFGQVLAATTGMHVELAIALAAGTVIAYAAAGGLMASVVTDLVQGIALILGLVLLLVAVLDAGGGLHATFAALDPAKLSFRTSSAPTLEVLDAWAIPILGSLAAQELVARILACRSPVVARRSTLLGGGLYLLVGLIPVLIGLVGARLVGPLDHPEQILPAVAARVLSPFVYVLFIGALISAILSTVDSALLAVSSLVARNLIEPLRPGMSERAKLRTSRLCTLVFGILAYLVGRAADGVHELVEDASGFTGGGFVVVFVFALWTRFGGPRSALAALLVGVLLWLLGRYGGLTPAPFLASTFAAFVVYVAVALAERLRR
ncbi:MAG TPA: sodium:solute symporter family protein [Nannocystis sp.]